MARNVTLYVIDVVCKSVFESSRFAQGNIHQYTSLKVTHGHYFFNSKRKHNFDRARVISKKKKRSVSTYILNMFKGNI